jgi:hypothetical protein
VVRESDCEKLLYRFPDGKVVDLSLSGSLPIPYARFLERRRELYALYATAFRAECLLMTPGLIEAWYDLEQNCYTNSAPLVAGKLIDPAPPPSSPCEGKSSGLGAPGGTNVKSTGKSRDAA